MNINGLPISSTILFVVTCLLSIGSIFIALRLRNHKIRAISNILLSVFSILIILAIAEAVLLIQEKNTAELSPRPAELVDTVPFYRVHNTPLYISQAGGLFKTHGFPVHINSLGFRERNFSAIPSKNTYRIIVIGDSQTFGVGVKEGERLTEFLEKLLENEYSEINFEVLNCGVPGFSLWNYLPMLNFLSQVIQFDQIILAFSANDIDIRYPINAEPFFKRVTHSRQRLIINPLLLTNLKTNKVPLGPIKKETYSSQIPSLALTRWIEKRLKSSYIADKLIFTESPKMPQFITNFNLFRKVTDNLGLPPPIAIYLIRGFLEPEKNNFRNPSGDIKRMLTINWWFQKFEDQSGLIFADAAPYFISEASGKSLQVSKWESHTNSFGHRLWATALKAKIKEIGLLEIDRTRPAFSPKVPLDKAFAPLYLYFPSFAKGKVKNQLIDLYVRNLSEEHLISYANIFIEFGLIKEVIPYLKRYLEIAPEGEYADHFKEILKSGTV